MKVWGISKSEFNSKDPGPYLISFIGSLWTSYGLFLIIKHIQPKNLEELLTISIGTWLFIVVGLGAKHYSMAGKCMKAFAIDFLIDLFGIILMSLVIWQY